MKKFLSSCFTLSACAIASLPLPLKLTSYGNVEAESVYGAAGKQKIPIPNDSIARARALH
jgi:hypothetical protein